MSKWQQALIIAGGACIGVAISYVQPFTKLKPVQRICAEGRDITITNEEDTARICLRTRGPNTACATIAGPVVIVLRASDCD